MERVWFTGLERCPGGGGVFGQVVLCGAQEEEFKTLSCDGRDGGRGSI